MQKSKPIKQAAFAGKALSMTGVMPLYNANGPSFRISSVKTSRIPLYVPAGAENIVYCLVIASPASVTHLSAIDSSAHQRAFRWPSSRCPPFHRQRSCPSAPWDPHCRISPASPSSRPRRSGSTCHWRERLKGNEQVTRSVLILIIGFCQRDTLRASILFIYSAFRFEKRQWILWICLKKSRKAKTLDTFD